MSLPTPRLGQTQHGKLELIFEYRRGRTVLVRDHQKTPLQIVRPFEVDGDGLLAYIINPTAGVLGGDTFHIRVEVGPAAKVVLLTQTANKIHRMVKGEAGVQSIEFLVASGARLEYYPERTIPFADSCFSQQMRVWLGAEAQFAFIESMSMGRIAHGECLAFRQFASECKVWQAQRLVYLDRFELNPPSQKLQGMGALEENCFYASGLFVGPRAIHPQPPSELIAVGQTAHNHLCLRGLAANGVGLDAALNTLRDQVRAALFELGALHIRR